ncbi:phosphoadenosine phosphosulfate reductase family protein [Nonomuraea sp. CA-218870]|uniref:phosphoadenosine phosphosulfate reductase domain-containing protein n=1 Tax=Nonomuraea sp. CA-218870 TaxID=3239998 RepID=UPI003D945CDD
MLIDSPRLTAADRETWARLEHYDDVLSRSPRLDRLADQARHAVAEFAAGGDYYVSTSWGKDSVTSAHLALQVAPDARLVWVRSKHFEMPECEQVRDAFLAVHPQARYEEIEVELRNPKRGEPGYAERHMDAHADHQDVLKEELTGRYVSGVRAEESRMRRISVGHRGLVTKGTCRPIGRWEATDVFAYLYREGLPVHPAYAMAVGGAYDRRWLRVHPLCSAPPARSAVYGGDGVHWEDTYFGDVIAAARAARRHLWP